MDTSKVSILQFGAVPAPETIYVQVGDASLEVTKKLPYEQVIEAIEWAVNSILDDRTFISAPLYEIIQDIAIVKFYTNLDTSDIGAEYFNLTDFYEWYDILQSFEVIDKVSRMIDEKQLTFFRETLAKTVHSLMEYRNSAAGIIDRLTAQNNKDNLEMSTVLERLTDGDLAKVTTLMETFGRDPMPIDSK